ncbi:MAG: rplU [Chlamydiales bacterium]|jgi:large subunit ribosomal protein L21|nr:rplU [Chlamydiales bacterium]
MYAIIRTGGKQYRVKKGDVIFVEKLALEDGSPVEFSEVLFFSDEGNLLVGAPVVPGKVVRGKLMGLVKGPKVESVKYKQRGNQRRRIGHSQPYSKVEITEIV